MQTILGAGGAIGTELAKALTAYTTDIRLVSRRPRRINPTDTLHPADLTDPEQIDRAIAGSSVCYLTIGFEYRIPIWQAQWMPLIRAVVASCMRHSCKLVFFDNVYAIGGDHVRHITEASPLQPSSIKGRIRAEVDRYIIEHIERGELNAIIARAPDFFGPIKEKSLTMNLIYDNLVKGKTAQWFCRADMPHSTGFTPDLAQGTAMLGNADHAYNRIWNLPVDSHAPTAREWVHMFAMALGKPEKAHTLQVLPSWAVRGLGLFIPVMKEFHEMLYQYDRPYVVDSSKFNQAFNFKPTSNQEAVQTVVNTLTVNNLR
jgi:nucleoside-diphosphate-sugar epimerase